MEFINMEIEDLFTTEAETFNYKPISRLDNMAQLDSIKTQLLVRGYVMPPTEIVARYRKARRAHNKQNKMRRALRKEIRRAKFVRLNEDGDEVEPRTKSEQIAFAVLKTNLLDYICQQIQMFHGSTCKQNQWAYAKHLWLYWEEVRGIYTYVRTEVNDFIWGVGRYATAQKVGEHTYVALDKYFCTEANKRKRTSTVLTHDVITLDDDETAPVVTKMTRITTTIDLDVICLD